jgi:hypothetical protein
MKKTTIAATLSTIITLSSGAHALELIVVKNYQEASLPDLWKRAKTDQVPENLLGRVDVDAPGAAYASVFPKTFMQENMFAVCHKRCADGDIFRVRGGLIDDRDLARWDVVEQSNVYYWLNRYFGFLDESLNYRPDQYLRVTTNRELQDETRGKAMRNNAFFNPKDVSLSFLPATNNLLFRLSGGKISRSGFDPSVVAHEASHYFFHHLFPNPVNDEIGGLNEGFADYIANIFLDNPKVGLVMLHGQPLRDSEAQVDRQGKLKTYEPNMPVHDLGERVAFALWKTRELVSDKTAFDRLVIDAVEDLGRDPYSSVHDFKQKMLERIDTILAAENRAGARQLWELVFPGAANKIKGLAFLNRPVSTRPALGFRTRQVLPENLAREFGTAAVEESSFNILQIEPIAAGQSAVLMGTENGRTAPHWVAIDSTRGNVLGIYNLNKNVIVDNQELEAVRPLAAQAKRAAMTINDFTTKIRAFSQLAQGRGEFAAAYKVTRASVAAEAVDFNGRGVTGARVTLELKRKLLAGMLLGLPEIERIELVTIASDKPASLPVIDGKRVIGYRLALKTGTVSEVVLSNYALD